MKILSNLEWKEINRRIIDLTYEKNCLIEENQKLNSSKGGYVKQINKLTKENKSLKEKIIKLEAGIDELNGMLNKAIDNQQVVIKLPSTKIPKSTFGMKIKSQEKISKIVKQIKEQ